MTSTGGSVPPQGQSQSTTSATPDHEASPSIKREAWRTLLTSNGNQENEFPAPSMPQTPRLRVSPLPSIGGLKLSQFIEEGHPDAAWILGLNLASADFKQATAKRVPGRVLVSIATLPETPSIYMRFHHQNIRMVASNGRYVSIQDILGELWKKVQQRAKHFEKIGCGVDRHIDLLLQQTYIAGFWWDNAKNILYPKLLTRRCVIVKSDPFESL